MKVSSQMILCPITGRKGEAHQATISRGAKVFVSQTVRRSTLGGANLLKRLSKSSLIEFNALFFVWGAMKMMIDDWVADFESLRSTGLGDFDLEMNEISFQAVAFTGISTRPEQILRISSTCAKGGRENRSSRETEKYPVGAVVEFFTRFALVDSPTLTSHTTSSRSKDMFLGVSIGLVPNKWDV
ncbi:hypothetical protein TNCV_4231221 [Trichonephila clavipes]|uniref:Uncharacterized protein n=1 Tax=Trichonephila clavipes TaxID=2585209 RepID=A0A8X6SHQ0_TRICX|nr:hypothetical protein TNCV_4231221 [Trichonephila clavipes]